MHHEQRARAYESLRSRGVGRALFASQHSVTWLTGYFPAPQLGISVHAAPPLVYYDDGEFVLLAADLPATTAETLAVPVVSYQGYTIEQPTNPFGNCATALWELVGQFGMRSGRLGVEFRQLSGALWPLLRQLVSGEEDLLAIDGWLAPLRMRKTDEELAKLRENFTLSDVAQRVAREAALAGQREIDVWAAMQAAVDQAAGCPVPMGNDCVVGSREQNIGGLPADNAIVPGDSLIVDISTLLHGYWSDSCNTYYAGEPSQQQQAMRRVAAEALELGIGMARPGTSCGAIDAALRNHLTQAGYAAYPHHSGHGVGVSGHEGPRVVPYSQDLLEPGMVMMLEPGIYLPGVTGVRLEQALLITDGPPQLLTHHL